MWDLGGDSFFGYKEKSGVFDERQILINLTLTKPVI